MSNIKLPTKLSTPPTDQELHDAVIVDLKKLALAHRKKLKVSMDAREAEMKSDDASHYLLYRVLGVNADEGKLIDLYQNKGRFLYKYAGAFLEEATKICFKHKFPSSGPHRIENTVSTKPKKFGIDCLVDSDAIEIKWRDATTDGDHINKEKSRISCIKKAGYTPIRVMFYYPNREAAIEIQQKLEQYYSQMRGQYYHSEKAWEYVHKRTGINLLSVIQEISHELV
jgi:type II restriction enzyme